MPSSLTPTDQVIAVAVPVPGLGLLSYRVPAGAVRPQKGARVVVPLGNRTVAGCVVDPDATAPAGTALRDVAAVLDAEPFLPPAVVDLARWVGEYYASGPGEALAMAIPPAAREGRAHAFRTVPMADAIEGTAGPEPRGPKQRAALALLRGAEGGRSLPDLARAGIASATVRSLATMGLVRLRDEVVLRNPFEQAAGGRPGPWTIAHTADIGRGLTPEQADVLASLSATAATRAFQTVLLHGVTGSGKTEIYLRLSAAVIASGRRVLVLVPEIALTPALAGIFHARFGDRVAIQHSGLSSGERHDQWHLIRRGDVDLVVGTRSAVFAPLEQVGLIVVDEEHEGS